jgi:hypothetical protein
LATDSRSRQHRTPPPLRAWARGGYVVAALIFPLENARAPGGPNEADLVNQPRDMSFVISRMLQASASRTGFFAGTSTAAGSPSAASQTAARLPSPSRMTAASSIIGSAPR